MTNKIQSALIALSTAFGVTSASAQEIGEVQPNKLNQCIAAVLQKEQGEYRAYSYTSDDRTIDKFSVDDSPAPNHIIGPIITVHYDRTGEGSLEIRGYHDGTVEDDGGDSAVQSVIMADREDVQKPASLVTMKGSTPLVDPKSVEANTVQVLKDIRACMTFGM